MEHQATSKTNHESSNGTSNGTQEHNTEVPEQPAVDETASLLWRLCHGTEKATLTFAGQGVIDLDAFVDDFVDNEIIRETFLSGSACLEALALDPEARWSGYVSQGMNIAQWLSVPETRPEQTYLSSCVVSQPLILLCQIALYRDLYARGLKKAWNEGAIDSAVGHSQGILPALLIAESPNGDICLERLNDYLRYAFWQGIAMATSYEESGHALRDGDATPMAAVSGMDIRTLSAFVDGVNKQLPPTSAMVISLHNTRTRFVLSGPIPSLRILHSVLEARAKKEAEKKKEGQFGGKPLSFTWEYLDVGGAYHSPYMETGRKLMQERVKALGFSVDASALQIDVYSPDNLKRYNDSPDLTQQMITEQFVRSVQWSAAIRLAVEGTDASFVLDFGPGDGVARLTRSALKGLGTRIVPLVLQSGQQQLFELFEEQRAPVRYTDFLPQRKTLADGSFGIENLYTRATGQRPVILPGMTPTTVEVPIVAAAANAGFTSELAGGGQVSERIFWLRMEELAEQLEPGREIVFNALYLDPYLWDLHVRKTGLVQKARKAGYPICGITISAGLPETSEAVKILDEFASLGMWLNAFKPGTVAQVKRVVEIAKAAPQHTIFVHLEGGKAGGHHSWEDLDQLLLESYHMIREQSNLVLCVGGGIADEDRGVELLNGLWSDKYGVPAMPVDAVFLGTLTMACLEAATSPQVKEALAKVAGGDKWVFAGKFDGGMTSGKSGLNADIHYIDNPASRCGRLLDSVAGDEEAVQARRDEIIETLNATAKPYFGDVEKMTYFEVAERLVSFLAIGRNGRYEDGCWLDVTYRARVFDFLRRAEGRLCEQEAGVVESFLKDPKALDTPQAVLKEFVEVYPQAQTQLLHPLDVRFFVQRICGRPGKPVNFIPVIDANVRRWYKSDSLWQAHDDRYEADKVLIIPGPEAVKGLKQADEPVASLLGRFEQALVQDVAERGVVEPSLDREESGWIPSWGVGDVDHDGIINVVASQPPHQHAWEDYFAERFNGPIASLFASHRIIDGKLSRPNPVRQLCRAIPGAKMRIQIEPSNKQVSAIRYKPSEDSTESVVLRVLDNGQKVSFTLTIQQETEDKIPSFTFDLSVSQRAEITNFALEEGAWSRAMRHFYHETMFGQIFDATEPFMSLKTKDALSRLRARGYASVTGGRAARDKSIPLNAAISLTWQPLFRLLSCDEVVDGLFHLVHLDNDFTLCEGWPILSDEEIEVDATITKLQDGDSGRTVQTRCVLTRGDVVCAQIDSTFFIRGFFGHTPFVAREKVELREEVVIADEPALSFLRQHEWLSLQEGVSLKVGDVLEVSAALEEQRPRYETPTFKANGQLTRDGHVIGDISIDVSKDIKLHPLRAWLNILTPATNEPKVARKLLAFETSTTPRELDAFAEISGDLNPIHRSDLVAWLGQLDGIIVHGMWTAARLGSFVQTHCADGKPERLGDYRVEFLAPAWPGESIEMEAHRVGAERGELRIEATAYAIRGGERVAVVRAFAKVKMLKTAYIFPGQGIQQQGMGMEGYGRSRAAKAVWDRADGYTREALGFSLLRIVRENPKELVVRGHRLVHPQGVLHLTQFTQVSMAVLAQAQVAELIESGVAPKGGVVCGHSVGEYNAIGVSGILPLESVIEIVYQRGMVMHRLVERDESGESGYRMAVIRPHYAGLDHAGAEELVQEVRKETGHFIQIVNYNVRGRQYSVTGRIEALDALNKALSKRSRGAKSPYVEIPGIDVPFHSEMLVDGVDDFRKTLDLRLPKEIDFEPLYQRYIPNLVPRPFTLDLAYIKEVYETTDSHILKDVVERYDELIKQPNELGRVLLIELLAWQFASPVRWIETQELMIAPKEMGGMGVERILEIGVGYQPTLANMARYSLKLMGPMAPDVEILNIEAEAQRAFYQDEESTVVIPERASAVADVPASEEAAPVAAEVSAAPVAVAAPVVSSATEGPADRPVSCKEALYAILAVQAKIRPDQIQDGETIDDIFDGVSSRRNQVLLDIGAEFSMGPIDGAHEKPVAVLAQEITAITSRYQAPGKYLGVTQEEALKRVLGRAGMGRKDVHAYLEESYGLGDGWRGSVMNMLALESRAGDSTRGGALGKLGDASVGQKADAKSWLDDLVTLTGQAFGVALPRLGGGTQAGGAAVDAAVVRELEDKIVGEQGVLMQTARDLAERLGHTFEPPASGLPVVSEDETRLSLYEAEHGKDYEALITPRFNAKRHVAFTSAWASAHRDVARLYFRIVNDDIDNAEKRSIASRLARFTGESRISDTAKWYSEQLTKREYAEDAALFSKIAAHEDIAVPSIVPSRPHLEIDARGRFDYREVMQRSEDALASFVSTLWPEGEKPFVSVGEGGEWNVSFREVMQAHSEQPFEFAGMTALITGASPGSIAVACVRQLLRGGARVIVTTTTYNAKRLAFYRDVYEADAAPGAELHVVPFNQASYQDIEHFVQWMFSEVTEQSGATLKVLKAPFAPDLVLPFGAIKDLATLDQLGERSDAVMRAMLIGVERLITAIATRYMKEGLPELACHVLLPLSPNHGSFGGDGLYAETKAALEVLMHKWYSERDAWAKAVSFGAARIGWVRGTGLMDANNPVAAKLEEQTGVRTFSNDEMGFMLTALCSREARERACEAPLIADLTGRFGDVEDLKGVVDGIRDEVASLSDLNRTLSTLQEEEAALLGEQKVSPFVSALPNDIMLEGLFETSDTIGRTDIPLDEMIVIVGMGEIGPCGSARTRFEMEVDGTLSTAGVLELAWMTGLVEFKENGKGGVWLDTETEEEVSEAEIFERYHDAVRERIGIRFTEPEVAGFDPEATPVFSIVYLDRDFTFSVSSPVEAESFVRADPEHTSIHFDDEAGEWKVTRRAGSEIRIPKKVRLSRRAAGLIPSGFSFEKYGVSNDMIEHVDRISLFNLIATVDAFMQAGLSPEELLSWLHPARVANTQGAGIGGMQALHRLYVDHIIDRERQNDTLQETLINVVAAYVVQSYVGSYGSMSHPVAACATAAVSLEEARDKLLLDKADFVVAGGYDDIGKEGAIGFADMNATAETDTMLEMGLEPSQMSRPNDVRRKGFLEAQGGGTMLLTRGDIALKMGLPVQGVLGYAASFGDGVHKSIPAPGMGALACVTGGDRSPLAKALRHHGMSADDIALVYKHDTSTNANDPNENVLHQHIQSALQRTKGNPLFVVSQKSLTGHPKGGAAAWQANGLCQALQRSVIPGNRNLDSVDPQMKPQSHLLFTNKSMSTGATTLKAGLITSLGFGHVSGVALVIHPGLFYQAIPAEEQEAYLEQRDARLLTQRQFQHGVKLGEQVAYTKRTERRFVAGDGTPCQQREEIAMLLDPNARYDLQKGVFVAPGEKA